jgi:hypothetical protein
MEHLLELYAHPYEKAHPLVCFDEKSVELHADVRKPFAMQVGKPKRVDYEYKRSGTQCVSVFGTPGGQAAYVSHVPSHQRRLGQSDALFGG